MYVYIDSRLNWQLQKKNKTAENYRGTLRLHSPLPLLVSLAGLEGHLQDFVSQPVAIQAVDGHGGILVVGHGHETEAFALIGVEISYYFHIDDCAEWAEHLP